MSAHAKRVPDSSTPINAHTDEEFKELLGKPHLRVVDVYAKWAGPCEAMQNILKRMKLDFGDDLHFAQAQSDNIAPLVAFRNKSCPTFLFFINGMLVSVIRGANAPLIERTIREQIDIEKQGLPHVPVPFDFASDSQQAVAGNESLHYDGETTVALIKPDAMTPSVVEQILELIKRNRFEIVKKKKIWFTRDQVADFYREHEDKPFFEHVLDHLSSAPMFAFVLAKDDAVQSWRDIMGPQNSKRAKEEFPKTVRGLFGTDSIMNAIYGADTVDRAERDAEFIFGSESDIAELTFDEQELHATPGLSSGKALVILKPDVVEAGKADLIIQRIVNRGFQILKREEINLTMNHAVQLFNNIEDQETFDVTTEYLTSAPVLTLVVKGEDVVKVLNELAGPNDPEIAKIKKPMSFRALFGTDSMRNAIYVSESNERAQQEIQFLFPRALNRSSSQLYAERSLSQLGKTMERTLAMIKPDAVAAGYVEDIVARIKNRGFKIIKQEEAAMPRERVMQFYAEHAEKPFYEDLVSYIASGPIHVLVLERENAIAEWRDMIGPTSNAKTDKPERAIYGTDGTKNGLHGSDSTQSASHEIIFFFGDTVSPKADILEGGPAGSRRASNARLYGSTARLIGGSRGNLGSKHNLGSRTNLGSKALLRDDTPSVPEGVETGEDNAQPGKALDGPPSGSVDGEPPSAGDETGPTQDQKEVNGVQPGNIEDSDSLDPAKPEESEKRASNEQQNEELSPAQVEKDQTNSAEGAQMVEKEQTGSVEGVQVVEKSQTESAEGVQTVENEAT
ncbi:nucleoside diphosphate kinase [Cladochytrium replicatum]|nr:nucleoside diphosphate kinase [Cladochytrium replicatum]